MRFVSDRPAGLSKSMQIRLIGLIAVVGLALLTIELRRAPPAARPAAVASDEPFDFAIRKRRPAATPDRGIRASMVADGEAASDDADRTTAAFVTPDERSIFEDNTVGLSRRELQTVATILRRLDSRPDAAIEAAASREASFSVLMRQPDPFRGEVVEFPADLRRLNAFPGLAAFDGPAELVEGWVFTSDAGNNPIRVLSLDAEASLPRGDEFEPAPVLVRGVFVKRFGYASRGGSSVAPLIIAKSLRRLPSRGQAAKPDAMLPAGIVLTAIVAMMAAVIALQIRERRRQITFKIAGADDAVLDELDPADDPAEFLEQLQRDAADD